MSDLLGSAVSGQLECTPEPINEQRQPFASMVGETSRLRTSERQGNAKLVIGNQSVCLNRGKEKISCIVAAGFSVHCFSDLL
jgi:hypothetical protein